MSELPQLIFVPGLRPKPHPAIHHRDMLRCIVEGLRRIDGAVSEFLRTHAECFEITAWNYPFYREYHDIELDRAGIELVLGQQGASERDRKDACRWRRRALSAIYRAADLLPFTMPFLVSEKLANHLRDLKRYVEDEDGLGRSTRDLLKEQLRDAARRGRPVMIIGHSMGSVIAYDALWELTHEFKENVFVDQFLSIGSPLGQRLIQRNLLGSDRRGKDRFPGNIRSWVNVSAIGDLTAIDRDVADDFADMKLHASVQQIEDRRCWNYFRREGAQGELNVHAEYGYLVNEEIALIVRDWWRRAEQALYDSTDRAASNGQRLVECEG